MLSIELLRMIQADRAREIAAADRVRSMRRVEPEAEARGPQAERRATRGTTPGRRPQTGTASATVTDPCA